MTSLEQKGDIAIYDAFNTYMDIDFLRRTVIEEDVETEAMSNLDFFQHYIKPEPVNYKEDNYDSMCAVCPSSLTENCGKYSRSMSFYCSYRFTTNIR